MNKPDGIDADIWEAAAKNLAVLDADECNLTMHDRWSVYCAIALALQAERNRVLDALKAKDAETMSQVHVAESRGDTIYAQRMELENKDAEIARLVVSFSEAHEQLSERDEEIAGLREAAETACDLLTKKTYGNAARSPAHNARLVLQASLQEGDNNGSANPPTEGQEDAGS